MITFENFFGDEREDTLVDLYLNMLEHYLVNDPFKFTWLANYKEDPNLLNNELIASREITCDSIEKLTNKRNPNSFSAIFYQGKPNYQPKDFIKLTFPYASFSDYVTYGAGLDGMFNDGTLFVETTSDLIIDGDDNGIHIPDALTGKYSKMGLRFHFDVYNFYTSLKDESKAIKLIKTIEYAAPTLKQVPHHWTREMDIELSELKYKYSQNDITATDWARII